MTMVFDAPVPFDRGGDSLRRPADDTAATVARLKATIARCKAAYPARADDGEAEDIQAYIRRVSAECLAGGRPTEDG